jgi:hypothetical protein
MKAFFETVWYWIKRFWVPAVIVAIGVVQMFVPKWVILIALVIVAGGIALSDALKK